MEDLEQIMRKIHVLFAKCEAYGNEKENKIIVPKKEVFRLLEQLNYAVVKLMDEYEGTEESRERGLGEYRRKGQKIIEEAQAGAEDVYAASLIYTDNMISGLEGVLSEARESLRLDYARMSKRLNEQAMMLETNQAEIKEQLLAMSQGEKYLNLILRENRRRQMEEAEDEDVEEEDWEEEDAQEDSEEIEGEGEIEDEESTEGEEGTEDEEDPEGEEGTESEEDIEAGKDTKGDEDAKAREGAEGLKTNSSQPPEKKVGKPNGKKKKGGQRQGGSKSGKSTAKNKKRAVPDLEREWEEEQKQRSARKVGTALYQDVGQPYDSPPKKVSYEIKVNEAYFEQLGEGNIDLDAEYEQWKKEQEGKAGEVNGEAAAEDTAATVDQPAKKEKRRWFGRKKQ